MPICQKCGSLLVPGKTGLKCSSCRYKTTSAKETQLKIKIIKNNIKKGKGISDRATDTLPKTNEQCPKCRNNQAFTWNIQTRAADEPETSFFECTKCRHRWRTYE